MSLSILDETIIALRLNTNSWQSKGLTCMKTQNRMNLHLSNQHFFQFHAKSILRENYIHIGNYLQLGGM